MNIEFLASLLTATYASKDTFSVQQAEAQLAELRQTPQPYLEGLLDLAASQTYDLRSAALTNFRTSLIYTIVNSAISQPSRLRLLQKIFELLTNPTLETLQKELVSATIAPIIATDHTENYLDYFEAIVGVALHYFKGSAAEIQGGLFLFKSLLSNFNRHFAITNILESLMPPVINLASSATLQLDATFTSQRDDLAQETAYVLQEWGRLLGCVVTDWCASQHNRMEMLVQYTGLVEAFRSILVVSLPTGGPQLLLDFGPCKLASMVNKAKANVVVMLNDILHYFVNEREKALKKEKGVFVAVVSAGAALPSSPFIDLIELTVQPLISNLVGLCSQPTFTELMQLDYIQRYAVNALSLLRKASVEVQLCKPFETLYKDFVVHGILPFLALEIEEIETFQDDPEEYVAKAKEICEVSGKGTVKNEAAMLLLSLDTAANGALAFSVRFALELLSLAMNDTNLAVVSQYSSAKVLQVGIELGCDLALLMLSILSSRLATRKDLIAMLEPVIDQFFTAQPIFNSNILRARGCLFWRCYSELLFKRDPKFNGVVAFLLGSLESSCPAVSLMASSSLNSIMLDDELMFRVEDVSIQIMEVHIRLIPKMPNLAFFETLEELVGKYPEHTHNFLDLLVSNLSDRVILEAEQVETARKSSVIISKGLNILKALCSYSELSVQELQTVELRLETMLGLLQNPRVNTFEDELLILERVFITKTQHVSAVGWRIFEMLPTVFKKFEAIFSQLLPLINAYLSFGGLVIASNHYYVEALLEMCCINLHAKPKDKECEATNSEGALVYQLMLEFLPGSLDVYLDSIMNAVIQRYHGAKQGFLKARLLGVVLCAFRYNAMLTMRLLGSTQVASADSYLKYVLAEIFANPGCFVHSYDKRVAVFGLCTLITQENVAPEVGASINAIFKAIIDILSHNNESHDDGEMLAQLLKHLEGNDSDDETLARLSQLAKGQFSSSFSSEEAQANLTLASLTTPLQKLDEYHHFKLILNSIRIRNPTALASLIGPLEDITREKLEVIVKSERVQINQLAGENTTVRRTVKAKKRADE